MPEADPLAVACRVIDVLERLGVRYSIGGSLASSFSGEPRSTLDVDLVVALGAADISPLVSELQSDFYIDADAVLRAVQTCGSANLVHLDTSIKIDLFVAGGTPLDASLLDRRRRVTLTGTSGSVFVHSPEDILLQKLRWFRRGGETSDRQWRDIVGIARVQAGRLDDTYLRTGAERLEVVDLLARAIAEAAGRSINE